MRPVLVAATALTLGASGIHAQQPVRSNAAPIVVIPFTALDRNNDGALSRDEMAVHPHAAAFDGADKDRDGRLSRGEFVTLPIGTTNTSDRMAENFPSTGSSDRIPERDRAARPGG